MRSFKGDDIKQIVEVKGQTMTAWEKNLLESQKTEALSSINKQIRKIQRKKEFGMGSGELEKLKKRKKAIMNFDKKLIEKYSRLDFDLKKATIYRENVIEQFDTVPEEFDKIKAYFLTISNPEQFFKVMQKSQILQDFFIWYPNPSAYGNFSSMQEMAEAIENELGI